MLGVLMDVLIASRNELCLMRHETKENSEEDFNEESLNPVVNKK